VLPHYPVQQYVREKDFDFINLKIYYGQLDSELYEDSGEGYDYQQGAFCLSSFRTVIKQDGFELLQSRSGEYRPSYSQYRLQISGLPFDAASCSCDGTSLRVETNEQGAWVDVPADFRFIQFQRP